jgi:hypothetical protein
VARLAIASVVDQQHLSGRTHDAPVNPPNEQESTMTINELRATGRSSRRDRDATAVVLTDAPDGAGRIHEQRWWTLAALCLTLVLISVDNTILNVAIPTLAREFDATASQLQWIVDSYVLVFAGLLLTAGS